MYPIEYTCTRNETTVTTRSITLESGSTSAATSTWKSPTPIQRYSVTVVACPSLAMTSKKIAMDSSADAPIAADAIQPVACPSQRFPKRPFTRNAASGNAGMSQTSGTNVPAAAAASAAVMGSSAHRARFVDVDDRTGAVGREHDREPDGDLGGRDDEDEGHEDAAALVDGPVAAREGDKGEVRGVQHELDAHEDDDGVAPHEHAGAPDEEERRGYRDVRADGDPSFHLGLVVPLDEHDRADEGREQQHGGDLERECEVAEQACREGHEVAASRQGSAVPELEGEEHHGERSEEHTSELQSRLHLVCRLLLEKKKNK